MTQSAMFPEFAVDANCIIGLDNMHAVLAGYKPVPEYTPSESAAVWEGLQKLAADNRLRVVPAVRGEIQRRDPIGYERLRQFPRTVVRINNSVRRNYQTLIQQFPDWAPRGIEKYDQGDPWLVAFAIDRGWTILSDEKRKSEQKHAKKNRTKLPDVCKVHSIECCKLREFAIKEGWI